MKKSALAILVLLSLLVVSGGRKSKHVISFHVQSKEAAGARLFEHPVDSGYFYDKSPVVHWKHITSYSPFTGDDGEWGCVFRMRRSGSHSLAATCAQKQGHYMLWIVQGKPRGIMKIDHYVDDGYIVAWDGITAEDIKVFDKHFKRIDSIDGEW